MPMLQTFDAPDALSSIGERPTTTVAPQALLLMNNPQTRASARSFAERVWGTAPDSPAARVCLPPLSAPQLWGSASGTRTAGLARPPNMRPQFAAWLTMGSTANSMKSMRGWTMIGR